MRLEYISSVKVTDCIIITKEYIRTYESFVADCTTRVNVCVCMHFFYINLFPVEFLSNDLVKRVSLSRISVLRCTMYLEMEFM